MIRSLFFTLACLCVSTQAQIPASCNTGTCRSQYQSCQALPKCKSAINTFNNFLKNGGNCDAQCFNNLISNDPAASRAFTAWSTCAMPCFALSIGQTDDDVFAADDDSIHGGDDDNNMVGDDDNGFGSNGNGLVGDDDDGQTAISTDDDDYGYFSGLGVKPACSQPAWSDDDDYSQDDDDGFDAFPYQADDDDHYGDDDDAANNPRVDLQRCRNEYKACYESTTCCPAAFNFEPDVSFCSSCMAKKAPRDATGKRLFNNLVDCVSKVIPTSTVSFYITFPRVNTALLLSRFEQKRIIATFAAQLNVPAGLIELQGLPTSSTGGLSALSIIVAITTVPPESADLADKIRFAKSDILLRALQANSNSFDASTMMDVSQPTITAGSSAKDDNTEAIAGGAAGGLILLVLIVCAIIFIKRKQTPKGEVLVNDDAEDPENVHPGQAWQPQTGGVPMQPVHGQPPMNGMQQPPMMGMPQQGYAVPQMQQQGYPVAGYSNSTQYAYPPQDDSEA
eukprot:TRINITY_DN11647_c1_g3_i5.p2 TRINITY_DN11647_c1_g3~~TRINITY_DN11647_c1_g3_i5.p2  ORF type:complete len:507 (+),score=128.13 TRINITY_DN11647_c1_g3_i5:2681-4201(+)